MTYTVLGGVLNSAQSNPIHDESKNRMILGALECTDEQCLTAGHISFQNPDTGKKEEKKSMLTSCETCTGEH